MKLLIFALLSFSLNAYSQTKATAVIECTVIGETIRFSYYKQTDSGAQNMLFAQGLDADGTTRSNCEYRLSPSAKQLSGLLAFEPITPEVTGYCPGMQQSKFKIGPLMIGNTVLAEGTIVGAYSLMNIQLTARNSNGTADFVSQNNLCVKR